MGDVKFEVVGLGEMEREFGRAAGVLNAKQLHGLNTRFDLAFRAVRTKTHVDTGYLRLSGRSDTHYDGDEWSGEMQFARHPGIFELARGNSPSLAHPEGGHYFFEAAEPHIPALEEEIDKVIHGFFSGAPI